MTPEEIRNRHYENLNSYRDSVEYQASPHCFEKREGELKTLIGNRWEIDEAIYMEFLEMLPPMGWHGDTFYMCEFCFDDITTKFSKEGGRYFCEFARYPGRAFRKFVCSYNDNDTPSMESETFACMAEDEAHAKEQCQNAYPSAFVAECYEADSD